MTAYPNLSVCSYRLHRDELDSIQDPEYRHRRLVELNVVEQCINLFKTGVVQRRRVETFKEGRPYTVPRIHACVFDPKTGDLNRLEVSLRFATRSASPGIRMDHSYMCTP
jgi:carbonic anhydrase